MRARVGDCDCDLLLLPVEAGDLELVMQRDCGGDANTTRDATAGRATNCSAEREAQCD